MTGNDDASAEMRQDVGKGPPARRLLVVSDNPELSSFLAAELANLNDAAGLTADFRYTRLNEAPQQMIALGAGEIDIKRPDVVAQVLADYDLVFSLHCKQIFPKALVEGVTCLNFHPGFNPHNRGWYPQAFSIINGLPAGATIHVMDAQVDHGYIVAQKKVEIAASDTSLEVYRKVIQAEKELIRDMLPAIIAGRFPAARPTAEGNYNGIKDYRDLCRLDLGSVGTLGGHLDLLRALSHGSFRNAYFTDAEGRKFYVKVTIEPE